MGNFQLHTPLGGWIAPTHRQWKWFYDEENECLQKKTGLKTEHYFLVGGARTRSQNTCVKLWDGETEPSGLPAPVKQAIKESAIMVCSGPKLFTSQTDPSNFWEYLERQGGHWMWEGWRKENGYRDLTWLVEGMKMAQLNGVPMALITGSRLPTSVEQDGCVIAPKPGNQ